MTKTNEEYFELIDKAVQEVVSDNKITEAEIKMKISEGQITDSSLTYTVTEDVSSL